MAFIYNKNNYTPPNILNNDDIKLSNYFDENDLKNSNNKLLISDKGLYSISKPIDANWITNTIVKFINDDPSNFTITDITGGLGGNIINFSKKFKFVYGIEFDKVHFDLLKNNLNVLNLNNTNIIHANAYNVINNIQSDIIFIDPPWGGKFYKDFNNFFLKLGKLPISYIINRFYNNKIKYVALKAPFNVNLNVILKSVLYKNFNVYKKNHILLLIFY